MRDARIKWVFLLPAVGWVVCFTLFPFFYGMWMSLLRFSNDPNQPNTFVGFENYVRFFRDADGLHALRITLLFVAVTVTAQMGLGLALALLLQRRMAMRGLLRTILTMPLFATPIAVGFLFVTIFNEEQGLVNGLFGLKIPWLSHPSWALVSVMLVDIWQWTPFCFLIFLAALGGIPQDHYEAAALETRSRWAVLRHVTLPALQPTILLVALLRITEGFKVFDIPYTLTNGGPGNATQVLSMYAYFKAFRFFDYGYGAAISMIIFAMVMVIILVLFGRIRQAYR